MRVLIAAGIYPPDAGGPAIHAKAQFDGLPKHGINTGLVAFSHYRKWPKGIRHLIYFFKLLSQVPKYDLVYGHDAVGSGIPALIAARMFGKKFMVRIGGDVAWESHGQRTNLSMKEWYEQGKHKGDMMFKLSCFLIRHTDLVVVPTRQLAHLYEEYYSADPNKIKVILNPIPEVSATSGSNENTIIFASRLASYKNLDFALKVLAKVFPTHPELKFIIMGDGPDKDSLQNLSRELGIESNVVFTGSSSQAEVLERTSHSLFVLAPALTEFNPNYVLQGIGFGKPFLISQEHGLPFQVPQELLFNPRSESELVQKVINLIHPDGYAKAVDFVHSLGLKMTWEDNLKQNTEVLKALLDGSK